MTVKTEEILRSLKNVHIFEDLSDDQLTKIALRFKELRIEAWEPLFSDRDAEEDFYIIQSGKIFIRGGEEQGEGAEGE